MARGVYQGADTMGATRVQSLWDVLQGQKRHEKKTSGQLGKRALASAIGDIIKTVEPGAGHVAELGIDQLSQQMFKLPKYEEEGSSFWGSSQIAEYGEQDKEIRSGADTSLLEGIIGGVGDYVGVGGDTPKEFDLSSFFSSGGGGTDMPPTYGEFSPEFMSQFMKNGGRVPKYEKGGRAPEKGDIDKLTALLELYSKGDPKVKSGKSKFVKGGGYSEDYFAEKFGIDPEAMSIDTVSYQDPKNYLFNILSGGEKAGDVSLSGNIWPRKMEYSKDKRREVEGLKEKIGSTNYMRIMSDLMGDDYKGIQSKIDAKYFDMDRFEQMDYDMKDFEEGGQVPSDSQPTIADYFASQGKTLGGNNIQSLSQILGR